ncbi:hypothetical protein JG688_00007984 [Phytophthora aleatoria]|uniref:Ubiquitin-like protease family profile domain-containing protein n=1 Tax=Phytophthora aleatoria TaxID=2496075 RepID=A0A8J5M4L7_9STRA|nr:hypothetical protein JG688_00007984 [Phytophthora aleatoria]
MSYIDVAFEDDGAATLADKTLRVWPSGRLQGFDNIWFNDNLVCAFTNTLAVKFKNNSTIFPPLKTPAPGKGARFSPLTLSLVTSKTEELLFMSLNNNSSHWTCLVVDTIDRGSPNTAMMGWINKRSRHNLLEDLAEDLAKKSLTLLCYQSLNVANRSGSHISSFMQC